jgi:AAA15 family ATPase/GTPase
MDKFLNNVEIKNFKSIKDLKFDAKKVNIFIGKPNVGKSNILEAMSMLGAEYGMQSKGFLSNLIRYKDLQDLFFDHNNKNKIEVLTDIKSATIKNITFLNDSYYSLIISQFSSETINDKYYKLSYNNYRELDNTFMYEEASSPDDSIPSIFSIFNQEGSVILIRKLFHKFSPVKKYDFIKNNIWANNIITQDFLYPPSGENIFFILQEEKSLYSEISSLFNEYGLELVLKINEQRIELQKKIDGIAYSYPYEISADTLQRYIFYLAALHSNKESILLLEEPEVHSFPPYTKMLADKITKDETNQYFITTHSPYLLHTIIENTALSDLNIFITYYENYETKVKALSSEDIRQILDDSIDVFFNLDRFLEA